MAEIYEEFAKRVESVRTKHFKKALTYSGSESLAMDAVVEAVYKALCAASGSCASRNSLIPGSPVS